MLRRPCGPCRPSAMKAGKEHVVPLSPAALQTFRRAYELRTEGCQFVFHGAKRDKPMSDMTLVKVLRDMGETVTAHGFRSSFRDWVSEETQFSGDLAEAALAHAIPNKVEAAYRRGNLLEKRRALMEAWSSYCRQEHHSSIPGPRVTKNGSSDASPRRSS